MSFSINYSNKKNIDFGITLHYNEKSDNIFSDRQFMTNTNKNSL